MKAEQGWELHLTNLWRLSKGEITCNSVEGQFTKSMLKLLLRKCYVERAGCGNKYFPARGMQYLDYSRSFYCSKHFNNLVDSNYTATIVSQVTKQVKG